MKKTWEGINNILARKSKRSKTITSIKDPSDTEKVTRDPLNMANVLNKHFASVGPTLANNLSIAKRHFLLTFLRELSHLNRPLLSANTYSFKYIPSSCSSLFTIRSDDMGLGL